MGKGRFQGFALAAAAVAVIIFLSAPFWLPQPVESVLRYELDMPRAGVMMVLSELSESEYFELDDEQRSAVRDILSAASVRRTTEKGNVIYHRDGFGWYQITFADEDGRILWPDLSVDSNGSVFIDNVKYEITDEQANVKLMELLASVCGR